MNDTLIVAGDTVTDLVQRVEKTIDANQLEASKKKYCNQRTISALGILTCVVQKADLR
jgi:hypothetical protein